MKYKEMVMIKLEKLSNVLTTIDSTVNTGGTRQEIRASITAAKTLLEQIGSLVQKESNS